jgi:hypothetical protein
MDAAELSNAVARRLAWIFPRHRDVAFLDYLANTYSLRVTESPQFDALCLVEAENGDVETGAIGGIVKRWWLADQTGFRTVAWCGLPRFVDDFDDADRTGRTFYRFPLVKFLRAGMQITFGEAFGPDLACRKVGRIQQTNGGVAIVYVRLVWTVKELGGDFSLRPAAAALDIDEKCDSTTQLPRSPAQSPPGEIRS